MTTCSSAHCGLWLGGYLRGLADLLAEHGTLGSGGFRLPTWSTRNSSGALAEGSLAPALRASSKRWWLGWLILVVVS
ncbi:MAG TPA: hypothetical protein VN327_16320, partial [Pseudonocardiaceae bacterium]|nr:hypothetical protein [Pseudonocardiaceae bacterium]